MRKISILLFIFIAFRAIGQEKLVEVNGIRYNFLLKGFEEKSDKVPTLIFESGMGVDLGNWDKIIDEISTFAPVFTYDRAGIGKSDIKFSMPTTSLVNKNLHDILEKLKIKPPYILVGHSLGGVYIRSFAGYYPNEVVGLVFIDPADFTETKQDWNQIFRQMGVPEKKIDEMLYERLYKPSPVDSLHFGPWSERQTLTQWRKTDFAEIKTLPLPDVPILFFVGGKFEVPTQNRSKDFDQETFFHLKNNSNMDRWKKLIYSSSKGGSLIYLTNAGHYIHRDEPKSIIQNIKLLVEQ